MPATGCWSGPRRLSTDGGNYRGRQPLLQATVCREVDRRALLVPAGRQTGDHKSLYQDVDGLRRGNLLDRHHTVHRGKRHERVEAAVPTPRASTSSSSGSSSTARCAWVTDLVPTTDNIVQLVRAARARWKIENEAFNTLKNQGYHLKRRRPAPSGVLYAQLLAHAPDLRVGRWPSACAQAAVHEVIPLRLPAVSVYLDQVLERMN